MSRTDQADHATLMEEVRVVRRAGLLRLRELSLPALAALAEARGGPPARGRHPVEALLREAVSALGGGSLQSAAEYTFGLTPGTRDWAPADRRSRAAQEYGVSVERFRKHHEVVIFGEVVDGVLRAAQEPPGSPLPVPAARPGEPRPGVRRTGARTDVPPSHRTLRVRVAGRHRAVVLHVHCVSLLRDVDAVVSPVNTHFVLPAAYKSSVAAMLRQAAAWLSPSGDVLADPVHDELVRWTADRGLDGRAARPGTVAVTGTGALADQGVRLLLHAAVAVPRRGTNDYDVHPDDVTRAVTQVFARLAEERPRHRPPLRSVALPLLGAGRGGLAPGESLRALWAAVEAETARDPRWAVHLVVRDHDNADLVERMLTGHVSPPPTALPRPGASR
ncbi:hypothetical protein [Streptomyces albidoflavus]|uniref:hypothetical protein n=1 Tax=Streptomyces albidoflavus TaxID=1886 RepID=UPI00101FCD8F|nr:hypothetical protein [Streptomyces albidoflavus]RZF06447.1 hypothetical protein C0R05_22045 [Streptomyces albidoflavus]